MSLFYLTAREAIDPCCTKVKTVASPLCHTVTPHCPRLLLLISVFFRWHRRRAIWRRRRIGPATSRRKRHAFEGSWRTVPRVWRSFRRPFGKGVDTTCVCVCVVCVLSIYKIVRNGAVRLCHVDQSELLNYSCLLPPRPPQQRINVCCHENFR